MRGVDALVALPLPHADLASEHAVVLHVVDDLEQREADDGLDDQVRRDHRTEGDDEHPPQQRRHQPGVQHVVREPPGVLPASGDAPLLQVPRRPEGAPDRARPELVEALTQPGRGGVLRGGDPHVVPAVVLDVEVAVEALRERDLGQPALVGLLLVAELMGGVDADPADAADGDRDPHLVERGQVGVGGQPAGDQGERTHEPDVLDRQEEVGDPAVVAVLLEGLDHVVGRVGAVEPGHEVDGRNDHQDHDRADPEPHAPPGQAPHPCRDERQRGDDQPDQPEVALPVAPCHVRGRRVSRHVAHQLSEVYNTI